MNIVAIETATPACALGVRTSSGVTLGWIVDDDRHHTEALTPAIDRALREMALEPRDLDVIVVDRGPGLYTGLRVGLATAMGLSDALGCQLVEVTSLELLAGGAWASGVRGDLVAAVDGRRGEIFVQSFHLESAVVATDAPRVVTPAGLVAEWRDRDSALTLTGDGAARYHDVLSASAGVTFDGQVVPPVSVALDLAATRPPVTVATPLYLREADAVANFSTRSRA